MLFYVGKAVCACLDQWFNGGGEVLFLAVFILLYWSAVERVSTFDAC